MFDPSLFVIRTQGSFSEDSFIYDWQSILCSICYSYRRGFCWQVATFIMQKILLDDVGLDYICTTAERFFAVGRVLGNMVTSLAEQRSPRLLKHIVRCYLRLSDNPRWPIPFPLTIFAYNITNV